ncbi:uncharacterized protein LOC117288434 [Asterias rubens]|uniref:uncharacterized protein LOC117288434 n=1 Tax=Asterias rubens TaxID=7604 RepID=UPI0014553482|nr:uncharacterized protein LOC117288434 [Asterias rubens]
MGYFSASLPSLPVVTMFVLATVVIVNTSITDARCANIKCVDVNSATCRFCNRRGGKRSENFGWSEDNNLQDETDDREMISSDCFLDSVVSSLPPNLQVQVYEIIEKLHVSTR